MLLRKLTPIKESPKSEDYGANSRFSLPKSPGGFIKYRLLVANHRDQTYRMRLDEMG